ncbi:transcription termination factor 4, mitochondrial [Rhodnius prolixus]|uniref:transcription termination factor 4, mitochondrial n=1 Tax=Rhodnius prolixus TaxID=13249 RepID=UPI003D18CD2A
MNTLKFINYPEEEFNITKSQIAKSGVLQYTLDFIKKRIEFLIRVGVYKKLQPKKSTHVNPRLDIIVRTSDKEFSTKVAGVTLLEYEVFQQIFQKEEDDD